MKYSQEEILYALSVIKETCEEHGNCNETCPFERDEICLITHNYPGNWKIAEETPRVWKGLL